MPEEYQAELKKVAAEKATEVSVLLSPNSSPEPEACIPVKIVSCSERLFRVTALVLRFMRNLKIKAKILQQGTDLKGEIAEAEVANAVSDEYEVVRELQSTGTGVRSLRRKQWDF